jgi:hypothetical protein
VKDLSPHARRVLAAARTIRVPESSKATVRRAVAASVAAGGTGASVEAAIAGSTALTTAGSTTAGHGVLTALALWGGAGIVTGIAVTAVGIAVMRPAAPKPAPTASVAAAAQSRPTTSIDARPVEPFAPARPEPSAQSVSGSVARARPPGVAEELRLLSEARVALRDGDPARALRLVAQHEKTFARGALGEEALTTRILALCALGRREQGRAGIAALERMAPNSPGLPRVRAACAENP